MNPISIRLLSQQLVSPQYDTPAEVVDYMGAMQAQDYRMVRWAVEMRTRKADRNAFRLAFDSGDIIRLHLLRGTWQLVSGKDYWWMLDLCAEKALAVLRGWMKSSGELIDDDERYAIREILVEETEEKGAATKEDFAGALKRKGLSMGTHRLSYHIRMAELDGTLCSGNLSPMKATYSLAESKVAPTARTDRDEMLMLLARKYFRSHSPATFDDFVWWSGLSSSDCKVGVQLLGAELHHEKFKDYDFIMHDSCRTRGFRRGTAHLLAPFDEYLVGYKSRELVISPADMPRAYTNNGIFFPVIANDGRICGNWAPWDKALKTDYFESEEEGLPLERLWERFCRMKSDNFRLRG